MKKLFLFKAVGNYLGGVAGAVEETEQGAIERLKAEYGSYFDRIYTPEEVKQLYDSEGGFKGEGFVLMEEVTLSEGHKDIIFLEIYGE